MNKKRLVKWDLCFLGFPNWLINNKRKPIKSLTIKSQNPKGIYNVSVADDCDRLPDLLDKTILYYLLLKKNKNIKTTKYDIAKAVFNSDAPYYYVKIERAVKRWFSISINFDGVFYTKEGHIKIGFHVIDSYKLTKRTEGKKGEDFFININEKFYNQLEQSQFFKYVDFDEFKKLKRPLSAMLYEQLIGKFKGRDFWKIGVNRLAEKLTLQREYPSQIIIKLKPAINEINKKTNFKFTMDYDEDRHICLFQLLGKEAKSEQTIDSEELNRLLALLPETLKSQRSVKAMLSESLKTSGYQHVQSNIIYTLQNAKKNMKAYLKKALLNDYGEESRAKMVAEEKKRQEAKAVEVARAIREANEKELWDRVRGWIEKHGGKEKALYQGYPVVACNADFMAVQVSKNERRSFELADVREDEFGKLSK